MILSIIFFITAIILNAVMDTLEEGRFHRSIFRKLNPRFWYKEESWKHAKRIFKYPVDAWHISKSLMIFFLILAISVKIHIFGVIIDTAILGIGWILIFNTFYNRLLRKNQ